MEWGIFFMGWSKGRKGLALIFVYWQSQSGSRLGRVVTLCAIDSENKGHNRFCCFLFRHLSISVLHLVRLLMSAGFWGIMTPW